MAVIHYDVNCSTQTCTISLCIVYLHLETGLNLVSADELSTNTKLRQFHDSDLRPLHNCSCFQQKWLGIICAKSVNGVLGSTRK